MSENKPKGVRKADILALRAVRNTFRMSWFQAGNSSRRGEAGKFQRRRVAGEAICLLALVLTVSVPHPLAAQKESAPDFETHIGPLFEAHCLSCHGVSQPQGELDLTTHESTLQGGKTGPALVPGSPLESLLLEKLHSGAMPMGADRLSDDQIDLVRRWIEAGAKSAKSETETAAVAATEVVAGPETVTTILNVKCLLCHGRRNQEGGLDLQTRASLLQGGVSGPAIVPGKPDESLLIRRIESQDMPPRKDQARLSVRAVTSSELERLRAWISAGAPYDERKPIPVVASADPLVNDSDRDFWSFRTPARPQVPEVQEQDRVRTPIDAFLLEKLEQEGHTFSPDAPPLTLMRRAYFDVTGLPPSPEAAQAYRGTPKTYEKLVDELLESPGYGEHWGRRWLDATGYSDSEGQVSADAIRPNAWRYRDYVIRSLNADKPYDRFLLEQIAGDELFDYNAAEELTAEQREFLVATGFMRMGPDGTYSVSQAFVPERLEVVASQVEILSSSVMGITMACARCHDHKYDPIPQRDYYRFSAILRTAYDPYDWLSPSETPVGPEADWNDTNMRVLSGAPAEEVRAVDEANAPVLREVEEIERAFEEKANVLRKKLLKEKRAAIPELVREEVMAAEQTPAPERTPVQEYLVERFQDQLRILPEELEKRFPSFQKTAKEKRDAVQEVKKRLKGNPRLRALFDMGGQPTAVHVLGRGQYQNPLEPVGPGIPSVLGVGLEPYRLEKPKWTTGTSGRRLALAKWLVQPRHPLTARVLVNRVWQYYFGSGLVKTVGNFGRTGSPPSHPELLDWLATEFVRSGWSMKALHRMILTSTAYRQSSRRDPGIDGDPDNRLLSYFPMRRLDADAVRDSILKVSGRLDPTPFGPPDPIEEKADGEVVAKESKTGYRRSIYLMQRRSTPVTMLDTFDAPQLRPNCLVRNRSTVSSQALQLMNSETVRSSSRFMAGRVIDRVGRDPEAQVERVYLAALGRPPSSEELDWSQSTLAEMTGEWKRHLEQDRSPEPRQGKAQWLALGTFCHTLFNTAEFLYID